MTLIFTYDTINVVNGVILSQTDGTNNWYFQYDTSGTPLGFIYNGTQYFYITNQMGDVIGITNTTGTVVANYEYDAWGTEIGGDTSAIAVANPLRYRGYYYDNETGYYYLQSRYYDPSICRFINSDIAEISQMSKDIPVGNNLFAYCNNDCVNILDEFGTIAKMDAAISIVLFIVYYVAPKLLKVNTKNYKFECKRILVDSQGNYIAKIIYYKSKLFKKSFVLSLGDKKSWYKATYLDSHLSKDFINNQANYIQSEMNKGATTSLTNSGPNISGINIASATLGIYLASIGIKTYVIKRFYNFVWGKKRVINWKHNDVYLFNISKHSNSKVCGWYAYRVSNWGVKKL